MTENNSNSNFIMGKCPNCGDMIDIRLHTCPSCLYILNEDMPVKSLGDFAERYSRTESVRERCDLIKNYPIPETITEILDLMIIAGSNIESCYNSSDKYQMPSLAEAWTVKLNQCYQKASMIFYKSADFAHIEHTYRNVINMIEERKQRKTKRRNVYLVIQNTFLVSALLLIISSLFCPKNSFFEMLFMTLGGVALIITATRLAERDTISIDYIFNAIANTIAIVIALFMANGLLVLICGIIALGIDIVYFIKDYLSDNLGT